MRKAANCSFVCAGLLGLALLLPRPAAAAWPSDPLVKVPLCTATDGQFGPTIVSDGAGGAIVTWVDHRSGTDTDIYAQRISAAGMVLLVVDCVALCTATGDQALPTIISDGAGGAIVTWFDYRSSNFDIYAQRISADGTPQWTANGVALCTATGDQYYPTIVSDGTGGAIVTWEDLRSGIDTDIYAQRISADGMVLWVANGVALCTAGGGQQDPTIVSDGAGAIVTWWDLRSGFGNFDIYAQRISTDGTVQWTANGAALCTATHDQMYATIVSDGAGGAIVTWEDMRSDGPGDIYAQRISAGGSVQWTTNGVALCTAAGGQVSPRIVSDGAGGAIVTYQDWGPGNNHLYGDIYAQRISATGSVQWPASGVPICTAADEQKGTTVTSSGAGGAIVTWYDGRSGNLDIYAQRVQANGELGGDAWVNVPPEAPLTFALDPVRPNPSRGGAVTAHFSLASSVSSSLELLDVAGRRIASCEVGSLGAGRHALDLGQDTHLAPGLYLVRLTQGTNVHVARVAVLK